MPLTTTDANLPEPGTQMLLDGRHRVTYLQPGPMPGQFVLAVSRGAALPEVIVVPARRVAAYDPQAEAFKAEAARTTRHRGY